MRCAFLKSKAIFMVEIIIVSLFSVYFLNPGVVYAQPVSEENACCERTLAGENCRYTLESNCDQDYRVRPFQSCEETDFCRVGCCVSTEGLCSKQVPKSVCDAEGFTWNPDANCNIPSCTKGCCVLGESSCLYSTESRCDNILQNYPELEKDFRAVDSELACTDVCRAADRGCCVNEGSCLFTTRGTCLQPDGTGQDGFYNDVFCSNENLNCECEPQFRKGCLEAEEDVYWFDSCGNPEDIALDCNYDQGTLCSEPDEAHEEAFCKSVNCAATTVNTNLKTEQPIDDYTGVPRKNGESWCLYDGAVGPSMDLVGSRHFRGICANAEELVEPCKDYRSEYCIQGDVAVTGLGSYREAACLQNTENDCATTCNSASEIEWGLGLSRREQDELLEEFKVKVEEDKSCCENLKGCVWAGDEESGVCVPVIPSGFELTTEEREEGSDSFQTCSTGSKECKTLWEKSATTGSVWRCVSGCECLSQEYFDQANNYCRSLGDCGAHFNYLGEWSPDGFSRDHPDFPGDSERVSRRYSHREGVEITSEIETDSPSFEGIFGKVLEEGLYLRDIDSSIISADLEPTQRVITGIRAFQSKAGTIGLGIVGGALMLVFTFFGPAMLALLASAFAGAAAATAATATAVSQTAATAAAASSAVPYVGWVVAAILAAIALTIVIITYAGSKKEIPVQFTCAPWQPPRGPRAGEEDTCKLCDEDPLKPCSKYRCNSIGQNCKFIPENEGSGRETCYNADPNDVQRPKIEPWPETLAVVSQREDVTEEYNLEIIPATPEFLGGFEIQDKLPPFAKITFGIKTDEPAQCRIGEEFNNPLTYSQLPEFFQDPFYEREHNRTTGPLTPGKDFEFYVICVDPSGNDDTSPVPPYVIRFSTEDGPDLEAPFIVASSIPDGKVSANAPQIILSLFVDEVSEFQCKYSRQDLDYELMESNMSCASGPLDSIFQGYSECVAQLNLTEGANTFNFRCQDNPENTEPNTNGGSYTLTLTRTEPLLITQTAPLGELLTNNVTLQAATSGGADNGKAICTYDNGGSIVGEFFETDASIHQQRFSGLPQGPYNFAVHCRDEVLNTADSSINFTVTADTTPPEILEIFKSGTNVQITLNEIANCQYANSTFTYGAGTSTAQALVHTLSGLVTYHLICQDIFNNRMPETIIYS